LGIIWVLIVLSVLVLVFLILWIRERRNARIEQIAYGLREGEDANEQTRTNITQMQAEFMEAIAKLEELNLVKQDEWGRWFWIESGKLVGSSVTKD
jgi:hypothetical protein